ncbi:DUF4279 domain-containing protein [Hymenobacter cellulosivorans]|uniref:DUF4279 domain-containing protein n=1 Tax=Hymenobacter cellulosivorans TaxID=2932249 RepID=A0ABY4FFT8_9BACT|nr:DUF4279 domain-containing protein [Hymenobacter cellulosivorans]UOQ55265.1 DUF4279 domain-containing protein [Hymenobacter cellulosivorans]
MLDVNSQLQVLFEQHGVSTVTTDDKVLLLTKQPALLQARVTSRQYPTGATSQLDVRLFIQNQMVVECFGDPSDYCLYRLSRQLLGQLSALPLLPDLSALIVLTIPEVVAQELAAPRFGVTQQFLAIHRIRYEAGQPLILHNTTTPDGRHMAWLAVENERFYFVMYLDPTGAEVLWVDTEEFHDVWLRATSATRPLAELAALTKLRPSAQWNMGDPRRVGGARHQESGLDFTLDTPPDTFENKLGLFLDFLEQDAAGIRALASRADCTLRVASYFHNGNSMLGGFHLNAPLLKRLNNLDLSIDFDLYATGEKWGD